MGAERIDEVVTLLREKKLDGACDLVCISSGSDEAIASVFADVGIDSLAAKQLKLRVYSDPTLIAYKHFETINGIFVSFGFLLCFLEEFFFVLDVGWRKFLLTLVGWRKFLLTLSPPTMSLLTFILTLSPPTTSFLPL